MKFINLLIAVCFMFAFSAKTFACDCDKKTERAGASATVADNKDGTKSEAGTAETCACGKSGEACKCSGHKDKKSCDARKDGKGCGCSEKNKKTT